MLVAVTLDTQKVLKRQKHDPDLWKTQGFTSLHRALGQLRWKSERQGFSDPALLYNRAAHQQGVFEQQTLRKPQ